MDNNIENIINRYDVQFKNLIINLKQDIMNELNNNIHYTSKDQHKTHNKIITLNDNGKLNKIIEEIIQTSPIYIPIKDEIENITNWHISDKPNNDNTLRYYNPDNKIYRIFYPDTNNVEYYKDIRDYSKEDFEILQHKIKNIISYKI
jgi:hypothetical protein